MSLPLFDGAAYPSTPTTPPGAPIGYVTPQQPQPPRGSALFSDAEIRARRLQFIELVVREVVKSITGFFVPGAGSATDQLRQWAENLQDQIGDWPGIGDLVEVLTGKEDGDLNDLGTYVNNMRSFLANIDFNDPSFNPLDAARQFITLMVRPFLNLLFSWVRPQWLPQVSLYSIGDNQPNLLAEPDFDAPETVDGGGFYWDGEDGKDGVGCAAIACDGEDHVLVSNFIPVSEGQKILLGAYVSHAGVEGEDVARVEVNTYLEDGSPVSTQLVAKLDASGNSTDWSKKLEGEFTVPAGVYMIAQQLHVTSSATSGVIKFDKCWVRKAQQIQKTWIEGLVSQLDSFWQSIQQIPDNIYNAFHNLGEWLEENTPIGWIKDVILGLLNIGTGAQSGLAMLEARVRALESAANTITLTFNGPSSNSPGPNFDVTSFGGGAGNMGQNGNGALVWKPSGAGNRTQLARYTGGSLTTDNCILEWVLASTPQSYLFDDAFTYILARMNGFTDYVRVRSGWDTIRIQAVVGGSVINIGPTWNGYPKAGDHFQWHIGDSGDVRSHRLLRNGIEILNFTETTSQYGAGHRHIGVGMETGNRLVFFQNIPAGLAVVTAVEVL